MISLLIISLCCVTAGSLYAPKPYIPQQDKYSFSPSVGRGSGNSFATEGEGAITGVRVWESPSAYIRGLQLQHDGKWGAVHGRAIYQQHEFLLYDNEAITQISGKFSTTHYVYQLIFITNEGRMFSVGQPTGTSFNHMPTSLGTELIKISGRADGNAITAIAAHWGPRLRTPALYALNRLSSSDDAAPKYA